MSDLPTYARRVDDAIQLKLKVIPGSRRASIVGPLGDRLKIKTTSPPEGGKANKEVLQLIRDWTEAKEVILISGHSRAEKIVRLVQCKPPPW